MNATVTKAASRSSRGATGQMAYAMAKVAKREQEKEAVRKVEEMAASVIKAANTPAKLYSVEDISDALGLSSSWVHLQITKDKPAVVATVGKRHFYGSEYLESLKAKGAKPRMRKVTPIARQAQHVTTAKAVEHVVKHTETLLGRLNKIEAEQASIDTCLKKITHFLGL